VPYRGHFDAIDPLAPGTVSVLGLICPHPRRVERPPQLLESIMPPKSSASDVARRDPTLVQALPQGAPPKLGQSSGLGQSHARAQGRIEDTRLLTGQGRYVADLQVQGLLHAVVVRSPVAHATFAAVDTTAARAHADVVAVYTAADLAADGVGDLPCGVDLPQPNGEKAIQLTRPVLARDRVRHVGDPVALVIAETMQAARDAAELVVINYDGLPAVGTMAAAAASGAPLVWDEVADNAAYIWRKGDRAAADAAIAGAAHVVTLESHVTRVSANSLEPRGALGLIDDKGQLVLHASHQQPYALKTMLAGVFKVPAHTVRVIAGDVGGSFGMKSGIHPEDVLVLFAARKLARPVRWIADRVESFLSDDHGRDVQINATLALDQDGHILALRCDFDTNIGAYLSGRSNGLINNIGGISGVYRTPIVAASIRGIYSNTVPTAPYRGAGRPEATYTIERLIDLAAIKLGVAPMDLRRRNVIPQSAMPYTTSFVFTYDCGDFDGNMVEASQVSDLAGFPQRRAEAAARGQLRGIGIANPVEVAGGPLARISKDTASVSVAADGLVTVRVGAMSTGQGLETAMSLIVADGLGIAVDRVRFEQGDTLQLETGKGSGGSGALAIGGPAVNNSVARVIASGSKAAGDMMETAAQDIHYSAGRFTVAGTDKAVELTDVARYMAEQGAALSEAAEFLPGAVTFPNGCHICEVEVDPETGVTTIMAYTMIEDIGNVMFPALVHGQAHGGIAQGLGQAMGEAILHDPETGQILTASFMDYVMPRADDMPDLTIQTRSVPTAVNPLGVKGVGEAGTVGSLAAIMNAISDALSPLGVHHIEMPATPDRVWATIQKAKLPQ
jgi:aerobic carbon-monoxide dehydrogenase large subunit